MALKVTYSLRETGSNLTRNLTLTVASIATIFVSLALTGSALNLRKGMENATSQWSQGVQLIVFMDPAATEDQVVGVGNALAANPDVDAPKLKRVDKQAAWEEVQRLFADSPEIVNSFGGPEGTPESWRVVPKVVDANVIKAIGDQVRRLPAVASVSNRQEVVDRFRRFTDFMLLVFLGAAVALVVSSALLIVNTIRLAMFARRREIEVMKLVGATNWFIRIPFMLEGLVQGLVGAVAGWAASWGINRALSNAVRKGTTVSGSRDFLRSLVVSGSEVRHNGMWLMVIGIVIGTLGSGIAVSRFLDV